MAKKIFLFLLVVIIITLFLVPFNVLLAEGRMIDLKVPIGPTSQVKNIGEYINVIYKIAIFLLISTCVIAIMVAGVLYTTAGAKAQNIDTAKNIAFSAIYALLIGLFSYLILHTINPKLVDLQVSKIDEIARQWAANTTDVPCYIHKDCEERLNATTCNGPVIRFEEQLSHLENVAFGYNAKTYAKLGTSGFCVAPNGVPEGGDCYADVVCVPPSICSNNHCQPHEGSCIEEEIAKNEWKGTGGICFKREKACLNDADCQEGFSCNQAEEICERDGCATDGDCGPTEMCYNSKCYVKNSKFAGEFCTPAKAQICQSGRCQLNPYNSNEYLCCSTEDPAKICIPCNNDLECRLWTKKTWSPCAREEYVNPVSGQIFQAGECLIITCSEDFECQELNEFLTCNNGTCSQ